ncbi:MAG: hypothetical protein AAF696_23970 [Bacteroidota bacterium]
MIFTSRGSPKYLTYTEYFWMALGLIPSIILLVVLFKAFFTGKMGLFLFVLTTVPILFLNIGLCLKIGSRKRVVELEIKEDHLHLKYFHKHLKFGEARIPRQGIKIYYENHYSEEISLQIKIAHPDGREFFINDGYHLWKKESIEEIFATIEAMNYPRRVV